MVYQPIQRRTLGLVVCLLGLASVLVWAGSVLDFTRVRTRTTRSLRADDSELVHEHGVLPTVECSTHTSAAISAHFASEADGAGVHIAPAAGNSPSNLFYASWTLLNAALPQGSPPAFAGFAHALRGPPSQS